MIGLTRVSNQNAKVLGLVLAANRLALNPAGFALALLPGDGPDAPARLEILTGAQFVTADGEEASQRVERFQAQWDANLVHRAKAYGFVVQGAEPMPLRLALDDETVHRLMELADDVASHALPAIEGAREGFQRKWIAELSDGISDGILLHLGRQLGGRWEILSDGTVRPRDGVEDDGTAQTMARCRFLARELTVMAYARTIEDAAGNSVRQEGQLYPAEVEELGFLCGEVGDFESRPPSELDLARIAKRLAELYALAMPGMRWWRGDDEARAEWEKVRYELADRMDVWREGRSEIDRLLSGDIEADEIKDAKAAVAELETRPEPIREAHRDAQAKLLAVDRSRLPMEEALIAIRGAAASSSREVA